MSANGPIEIRISDEVKLQEGLVAERLSADGSTAIRVNESGTSASFDQESGGPLAYSTTGQSPPGERDSLRVCNTLIEHLNDEPNNNWESAVKPDQREAWIDGLAYDRQDRSRCLRIQVTRAYRSEDYWQQVGTKPQEGAREVARPQALAAHLYEAILEKKNSPKDMVLALNAIFTPAHADRQVVSEFRRLYGNELPHFISIWVIGPTKRHVFRLDSDPL